jgi:oligopeptide transport system substrate-binding protein
VGYSNAEYDALVSPQGKTADQAYQDLQKAESILLNDAAIIPLYQGASIYLQNPAVHDVYYFISGYDSSFKWAYKDIQN